MTVFRAACIQMTADSEHAPSIAMASELIRESKSKGADYVQTPEASSMMEPDREALLKKSYGEGDHPAVAAFSDLAQELDLWLHIGSLSIGLPVQEGLSPKAANRSFVFRPDGSIAARYDKIHMFDVSVPDGQSYRESAIFEAGQKIQLFQSPFATFGLSICYDIRFGHLYRRLAQQGADILCAPAAFTRLTGQSHWHVLQRARAIENGCFLISAGQCGTHARGRETYGHSLIVSPWGDVIADAGTEIGVITADIDLREVKKARSMIPSLSNDRLFDFEAS